MAEDATPDPEAGTSVDGVALTDGFDAVESRRRRFGMIAYVFAIVLGALTGLVASYLLRKVGY